MSDVFDRIASLSPKRLALLAHELNDELAREKQRTRQPIAVIGLACRFPGGADDPETLWRLLLEGRDLVGPAPSDRWGIERPIAELGKGSATPEGGYLRQVDQFDPLFFGISPREAETMDPQQRLLLEVTWEALENAAIAPDSLKGTRTGVFIGIAGNDFTYRLLDQDVSELDSYTASGGSHAIAAGRLAYTFDLAGPCLSIDTACSSSLVSIANACDNLRLGRADLALAGGVSLILSPETTVILAKAGMLSSTFRCRSFDASADGFVRGEGCGIVVLKRLSDAERDRDRIMAVIRGVAVNQDGRSSGLTAPRGPAQQALLREALVDAGVEPGDVSHVETHGTGTGLGDPIEAQALTAVYGRDRAPGEPLRLGSLKANVGHLEAAAGVAGAIKLVLSLEHGMIPPIPHLERPNPHVDWARSGLALPREPTPWPRPRIGGVSSFGFSGTNAHLLLAAAPVYGPPGPPAPARSHHLFCLSAKTPSALRALATRYVDHLEQHPHLLLEDVCFAAGQGRKHHQERLAVVSSDSEQLRAKLAKFAASPPKGRPSGEVPQGPSVAFLFTGQGSQYMGMAAGLYQSEPTFAAILDKCSEMFRESQGVSLTELLYADDPKQRDRLNQTGFTQPALFAVEVALAQLLVAWGVPPAAGLGHSVGELAAACTAGVFDLSDGMRLIARRAALMQSLPSGGGMAAVLGKENDVRRALRSYRGLSIAGLNGPNNVVVSGALAELDRLIVTLESDGIPVQKLTVSHAFHSALLEPILGELARAADQVPYGDARFPVMSNLTGRGAQGSDLRSGTYWRDQARQPVRFTEGVQAMSTLGCTAFLEIGPSPVLTGMARRFITDPDTAWLPTLRPGRPDLEQLFESLGELYMRGINLDFAAMNQGRRQNKIALPTYPFERSRYWPEIKPRSQPAPTPAEPWVDWLYELEWREDLDAPAVARPPTFIPSTGDLLRTLDALVEARTRDEPSSNDVGYRAIDDLCRDYIVEAIATLGFELRPGDRFATEMLRSRLGVLDRHTRLFARLLAILAEDGVLTSDGSHWTVVRRPKVEGSRLTQLELEMHHPHFAAELAVLASCGPELAAVLQGRCDPMQLLFPAGALDLTTRLYSEPRPMIVFNGLIEACVGDIVERLPANLTLRVLEVGAGSGGTAARVLPRLPPDRSSYVFTDISPGFLDQARDRFKAYQFVDYDILNLENPPSEQQRFLESFDIIIAANVVHATRDLRRTLAALGRMMKPEGLLVILEVVQPQRMGDLTVGMTDGWWAFTDHDVRSGYPLVSRERWVDLLEQTGFVSPVTAPHRFGADDRMLANQTILLAKRAARLFALPQQSDQSARGRWLILTDRGGLGRALGAVLRARGGECVFVERGEAYREIRTEECEIDALSTADHERVLRAFQNERAESCRGVVYLWGLDAEFEEDDAPGTVLAAVKGACGGALILAQSMARSRSAGGLLAIVTRGGRTTDGAASPARPAQAALWSMAGVVALEHPGLSCRRIELELDAEAPQLADELLRDARHAKPISLTSSGRRMLRLHRSPARDAATPVFSLRSDAAYMVTGGFTGLGLQTARWLAERGAGRLILVGRRPPSPEAERVIAELSYAGAAPLCLQADVGSPAEVERVFEALRETGLDLAGVVHSAGALSDGDFLSLTWQDFEQTMRAKVEGGWALHRHTRFRKLDFFVLYSSGASVMGSIGQANHAAANGFLDALAFHRRGCALPALSINWGPWRDVGAAASHGVLEASRRRGVESIGLSDGFKVLERLIGTDRTQVAVLPIDWARFDATTAGDASLFADFKFDAATTSPQPAETTADDVWREKLMAAAPGRRRSVLAELLENGAAKTLRLSRRQSIESHVPLSELGLDSLMALQLRNELAVNLQVDLAPTLLYNYPTLDTLADYLLGLIFAEPPATQIETLTELDDLSEEDLARLLEEQIELG